MRLVFIADEFKLRTPAQQLLDRFLIGYPHAGKFHKPDCEVILVAPQSSSDIERRIKDFRLQWHTQTVSADGAVVFNQWNNAPPAPRSFVYGAPAKGIPWGTAGRGAWLLPEISRGIRATKGLAVVQGPYPTAEIEALDALLPMLWRPGAKVRAVERVHGDRFWEVLKRDFWALMKAAISRSDSPQGDPVRDGRTQDLLGLGLLERLVKAPRGWVIEQSDAVQYVIAVMDGAVADYNIALQTRAGGITSAQVHRPPAPGEHHYSRLAAMLEQYFLTGLPPWPAEQNELAVELLNRFAAVQS